MKSKIGSQLSLEVSRHDAKQWHLTLWHRTEAESCNGKTILSQAKVCHIRWMHQRSQWRSWRKDLWDLFSTGNHSLHCFPQKSVAEVSWLSTQVWWCWWLWVDQDWPLRHFVFVDCSYNSTVQMAVFKTKTCKKSFGCSSVICAFVFSHGCL